MKTIFLFLCFLFVSPLLHAQDIDIKGEPETFEYEWEGKTYTMQKYFIVFLKKGPKRDQPKEEADEIQKAHLAYLGGLFEKGLLNLNGPTGGDAEVLGISVYNVPKIEDAIKLASNDPAVKAGRLIIEAKPWWLAKGSAVK